MRYDYQIYLGWIRGFAGEVEATKDFENYDEYAMSNCKKKSDA